MTTRKSSCVVVSRHCVDILSLNDDGEEPEFSYRSHGSSFGKRIGSTHFAKLRPLVRGACMNTKDLGSEVVGPRAAVEDLFVKLSIAARHVPSERDDIEDDDDDDVSSS